MQAGDLIARRVLDEAVEFWAMALANLVSVFNPEQVIFGGGVFGPGARFLDRICEEAARWAQTDRDAPDEGDRERAGRGCGPLRGGAPGARGLMTAAYRRPPVFAAACSGMLLFGIVFAALGPILTGVITRFGLDRASAGALFSLLTLGVLIGSLAFGPAVDRYGYKVPLLLATALMGLGLKGMALGGELALFRAGVPPVAMTI